MPSAAVARDLVIAAAGPRDWADTREAWLSRAARRLGVGHRRVKALFYGEAVRLDADEYLSLLRRADQLGIAQSTQEALNEAASTDLRARAAAVRRRPSGG